MRISAKNMHFKELNEKIRAAAEDIEITDCCGQRFIGSGGKKLIINGTPGNALGAYLNGGEIIVNGNAQDAVGDTMNDGKIIINGNAGDTLGYAMRGGSIFVKGNAGYRTGIHMKEYKDKKPVLVIGGAVGSFLGEYLAGGLIIVLGIDVEDEIAGSFTGTGMHGGKIFLRTENLPANLPKQVTANAATSEDLEEIKPYITEFSKYFETDGEEILKEKFHVLKPNAKNPYKQLYVEN